MIEYAQRIAYSTKETLLFTQLMATIYKYTNGCFVECGVAAGAQIIAMRSGAQNKVIHAFDSFEGIPLPSSKDDQIPGIKMLTDAERNALPKPGKQKLESTGVTAVSVESFKQHLVDSGAGLYNICIHKGWFEEIIPFCSVGPISILRLDGDLYNSTMVCLKHLYPNVIEGGCVIIDDWELTGSREAVLDYFGDSLPIIQFVSNIAYFIKP